MTSQPQNAGVVASKRRADEHAAAMEPVIKEIQAQGITTAHGIAMELNRRGYRAAKGGLWACVQVRRLLVRLGQRPT